MPLQKKHRGKWDPSKRFWIVVEYSNGTVFWNGRQTHLTSEKIWDQFCHEEMEKIYER